MKFFRKKREDTCEEQENVYLQEAKRLLTEKLELLQRDIFNKFPVGNDIELFGQVLTVVQHTKHKPPIYGYMIGGIPRREPALECVYLNSNLDIKDRSIPCELVQTLIENGVEL